MVRDTKGGVCGALSISWLDWWGESLADILHDVWQKAYISCRDILVTFTFHRFK